MNEDRVLVLADTTDINYNNHKNKKGMGRLGGQYKVSGICLHTALAVTTQGVPLGVVGQHYWAPSDQGRVKSYDKYPLKDKESYKWILSLQAAQAAYQAAPSSVTIVSDRESDFYEYLSWPRADYIDLLVRAHHLNRKIELGAKSMKLKDLSTRFEVSGYFEVSIKKQHNRAARKAKMAVRFGQFTYPAPQRRQGDKLTMYLVHVKEVNQLADPIEWYLLSTMPVENFANAVKLIQYYAHRWIIERFFYTLKTALNLEKLQVSDFDRLVNIIKLYSISAWRILRLKYLVKVMPQAQASEFCNQKHLHILKAMTRQKIDTVEQFVLALATLVGFKSTTKQPYPGEKLLWQANSIISNMQKGWDMANNYGTG
jgi:hypothetical protein